MSGRARPGPAWSPKHPLDYDEVLAHPQYAANDSIDVGTHPLLGSMHRVKPPARFGGARLQPSADSPDHGQHTAKVLADNGYSDDQISDLFRQVAAKPADEVTDSPRRTGAQPGECSERSG